MTRVEFKGAWKFDEGTAVGSKTFGRYHSNPCVLFRLRKPGKSDVPFDLDDGK